MLASCRVMQERKSVSRVHRVASEIKKVLSQYLIRGELDPCNGVTSTMITITDVTVSPCLQHVKVYVSPLVNSISEEDCLNFLNMYSSQVRYYVGQHVRLKVVPEIIFRIDESFKYAERIETILKGIHKSELSEV